MRAPRLEDIIAESMEARLESLHTAEPGWVLDYDGGTKTATAQPAIAQPFQKEDGTQGVATKPPTRGRVCFPGGVVFRLEPGDPVLIIYCSGALDNWVPGRNRIANPGDERRNTLSDALIIPMGNARSNPAKGEIVVEYDKVKLGKVGIGSRSPVVRRVDIQAGRAVAGGALSTAQTALQLAIDTANAPAIAIYTQQVAVLTPLVNSLQAILDIMSNNVEAT